MSARAVSARLRRRLGRPGGRSGAPLERRRLGRCAPTGSEIDLLRSCLLPREQAIEVWTRWRERSSLADSGRRGQLLLALVAHHLDESVDDEVAEFGRQQRRHTWVLDQQLLAVAAGIIASLPEGVEPLVFKGAALAHEVYPPGLRSMSDLDLAITGPAFDTAVDELLAAGWEPVDRLAGMEVLRAVTLADARGRTVDLHRWPLFPRATRTVDGGIVERSVPGTGLLSGARVPAPADAIVLSIVHGLEPTAASGIRWPVDVAMLADSAGADRAALWHDVAASASELGVAPLVGIGLDWCRAELGLDVDAGLCERLRNESYPLRLRAEWATKRLGLMFELRTRYYVDVSRALGRRASVGGYVSMRRAQLGESGGPVAFVRRRTTLLVDTAKRLRS